MNAINTKKKIFYQKKEKKKLIFHEQITNAGSLKRNYKC